MPVDSLNKFAIRYQLQVSRSINKISKLQKKNAKWLKFKVLILDWMYANEKHQVKQRLNQIQSILIDINSNWQITYESLWF